MVRVSILVFFLTLGEKLWAFHHWVLCWLWVCSKRVLLCWGMFLIYWLWGDFFSFFIWIRSLIVYFHILTYYRIIPRKCSQKYAQRHTKESLNSIHNWKQILGGCIDLFFQILARLSVLQWYMEPSQGLHIILIHSERTHFPHWWDSSSWIAIEFYQMIFCVYWKDHIIFVLIFVNVVSHI